LLLVNVRNGDAYRLLNELCQRFESVKATGVGMNGYYDLLAQIARQTNTTQMPLELQAIISEHPELSHALHVWYRKVD
jgi:hypothetical protein